MLRVFKGYKKRIVFFLRFREKARQRERAPKNIRIKLLAMNISDD